MKKSIVLLLVALLLVLPGCTKVSENESNNHDNTDVTMAEQSEFTSDPAETAEDPANSEESSKGENELSDEIAEDTSDPTGEVEEPLEPEIPEDIIFTEMSDNLLDFTFELDGVLYQLPCQYSKFIENGWKPDETRYNVSEVEKEKMTSNSVCDLVLEKDDSIISVNLINLSGDSRAIKDCNVGGIVAGTRSNKCDIVFPRGISLMNSSIEDIKNAYGEPESENKTDTSWDVSYGQDGRHKVAFAYNMSNYGNTMTLNIFNYQMTAIDYTVVNPDVPEYLASYKAPEKLGDNVLDMSCEIDGKVYQLPAPVSEFFDDGWKFGEGILAPKEAIDSGRFDSARLIKGDMWISVDLMNFSDYKTIPQNCAVYKISYSDDQYNPERNTKVTIAGGISVSTPKAEVETIVGDSLTFTNNYYYDTSFKDSKTVYIYFDDSEFVERIIYENNEWNY